MGLCERRYAPRWFFFWLACARFFDSLKPVLDSSFNHFGFGADEAQRRIACRFTTLRTLRARRLFDGFLACVFHVGGFWKAPPACEIITFLHYNICVNLRLSAVEKMKMNCK